MNLLRSVSYRVSSMIFALALRRSSLRLVLLSSSTLFCDASIEISLLRSSNCTCNRYTCFPHVAPYSSTFNYKSALLLRTSLSCLLTSRRSCSRSSSSVSMSVILALRREFSLRRLEISSIDDNIIVKKIDHGPYCLLNESSISALILAADKHHQSNSLFALPLARYCSYIAHSFRVDHAPRLLD